MPPAAKFPRCLGVQPTLLTAFNCAVTRGGENSSTIVFVFGAGSVGSAGEGIDDSVQAIVDSPLSPTLRIASNGGITVVDPPAWQQGGLPAALFILDDVEETLSVTS